MGRNKTVHINCRKMQKLKFEEKKSKKEQKSDIKRKTPNEIVQN